MKTIIVGGGKVGYNLFKTLKERGHKVCIIERSRSECLKIAEDFDVDVICGDGTELSVLKDAGIDSAEIIVAVTGADEENLVICQTARLSFPSMKTIARINNPKNIDMFEKLGIDNTVCSTEVIANLIEYSFDKDDYRVISTLEQGTILIAELFIRQNNKWANKCVKELVLPKECVLVSIMRNRVVIYPRGETQIYEGDKILIMAGKVVLDSLIGELYGGDRKWGLSLRKKK